MSSSNLSSCSHGLDSTFKLFDVLGMERYNPTPEELVQKGWNPKPGNLVPYYLKGANTLEMYNDVQIPISEGDSTSTAASFRITGLPK